MAQVSMIKTLVVAMVVLATMAASAPDLSLAPAPTPDAGAAFSLPVSAALIASSLLFSVFALLRH